MTTTTTPTEISPAVTEFLQREPRLLIDGDWQPARTGATFPTLNPATGKPLCHVAAGDAADVDAAVRAAQRALPAWAALMPAQRERLLHRFADLMEAHKDELAQLETLDNGKPFRVAYNVEINVAIGQMRYYAGWPTKLTGETYAVSSPGFHVYTRREPVGVCAAITPWNYSLVMAAQKIGPALAAGNTLVLKPAEQTPLTALKLGELALEAGIPPGVLNVVTGFGHTAGAALSHHPGVAKVAFTGSTEVGKAIQRAAAETIKRVSLELGGKSPLILFDDVEDLDAAAEAALWAIFSNSGQNCVAGSRLFVQAGIYEAVLARLAARAQQLVVGPGIEAATDLGPLISAEQLARVQHYIEAGLRSGATLITGGERPGGRLAEGYFLAPTIFAHVADNAAIACEEIFGPVLSVFRFEDEEEVLARANALPFGLAAGVWTQHLGRAHRMAARLKAGVVWINTYDWFDPAAPFGGMGESGLGRELGRQVMDAYTELKTVWVKVA
ncbi:MAG TPA: betaine-aldehyde dehydrogenase [Chloroflexi bacterium]|nr:betaine-aldehyde dehydrogenase [Chloroflexota bacterium]HHW86777.1 aldehyde dehydrogenase family protein [Chloroflexota bacterium]